MNSSCGCSAYPFDTADTLVTITNRPGLSAISYRIGTWSTFMEVMKGRLGYYYSQLPTLPDGPVGVPSAPPMTREPSDPAIALLDAWAMVADVLTFYQERIANEGYLRTATEQRSLQELARLVGYAPRPGVAASVTVAYSVQDLGSDGDVSVPAGSSLMSMPTAGEVPRVFETSTPLVTRASRTSLALRTTRAQQVTQDAPAVYINGTSTRLKANDPLLIVSGSSQTFRRIGSIDVDVPNKRITLALQPVAAAQSSSAASSTPPATAPVTASTLAAVLTQSFSKALTRPPALHPVSAAALPQSLSQTMQPDTDTTRQMLVKFSPALQGSLDTALRNTTIAPAPDVQVYAFNVQAAPFGSSAPKHAVIRRGDNARTDTVTQIEWEFQVLPAVITDQSSPDNASDQQPAWESPDVIYLDAAYDKIVPGSWMVVCGVDDNSEPKAPVISQVKEVHSESRADYGISAKTSRIRLASPPWFDVKDPSFKTVIRGSVVYAQSEALDLADEPVTTPVSGSSIELADLHEDMTPGQWLVVSGERTDVPETTGVTGTELVMLGSAKHSVETVGDANGTSQGGATQAASDASPALLPGGRMRTTLTLAAPLAYTYRRDSLSVSGNVTTATHGETHTEILGSGDGRAAQRSFVLRRSPLTHVAAPTPSGIASTLQVSVNGVGWQEVKSFRSAGPNDHVFVTDTLADGTTRVTFGNGTQGANLPSGIENVRATYRTGIGADANADAGQLSQLVTRPLGVMSVVNPIAASGGADPDSADDIRHNMALGLASLDRLVSVADFADFSRNFAGVAKASACRLAVGGSWLVHVTVAAAGDAPLVAGEGLLVNLRSALAQFGDPHLPVRVAARDVLLLVISARVRVTQGSQWTDVEPLVRAALLDTFSFERRELGQSAALSEVLAAIQSVAGVDYADVGVFDRVSPDTLFADLERIAGAPSAVPRQLIEARLAQRRRGSDGSSSVRAAQIAYLSADVPGTLTLTEIAA
ncbi:putative baseplate assembly protein [Paraburkholderia sp. HP33-1]|uniref:putative baseplate assembly protein n=1 Tax=Paraburkholderia sp. HP33-1 TaxID=2883243 RepID=UPI001F3038F0|nr:putative baseplate assembly protein [Paraburkholderia sp. HP33-1]